MAENSETGKKEDSNPLADPLRGDGDAGAKRQHEDGDKDSKDTSSAKKQKISISLSSKKSNSTNTSAEDRQKPKAALTKSPIAMKFGLKKKPKEPDIKPSKSLAVSKVFCESSDDDEEEMPPEAKMRMKNLGRGTITSAGPNSFNKSKEGFINTGRAWRLKKEEEIAKAEHEQRMKELNEGEGWDV